MKKKTAALLMAFILLIGCAIGGTVAWLTAQSDTVTNTFTTSNITVKIQETTGDSYKMIPGHEIVKDPKVWVVSGSEDCYLFVKLDWKNNTFGDPAQNYLNWSIADGWTPVPGETNVYFRTVTSQQMSNDDGVTNAFSVLRDNKVTVKGLITKEQMNAFTNENLPKLTITAYASQLYKNNNATDNKFTPQEAWNNVNSAASTTTP